MRHKYLGSLLLLFLLIALVTPSRAQSSLSKAGALELQLLPRLGYEEAHPVQFVGNRTTLGLFVNSSGVVLNYAPNFLPTYARNNPSGYSYLCLKEIEVEKKLPIGIWFEVEPDGPLQHLIQSGARIRLSKSFSHSD